MHSSITIPPYNVPPAKPTGDQSGTSIMGLHAIRRIKSRGEFPYFNPYPGLFIHPTNHITLPDHPNALICYNVPPAKHSEDQSGTSIMGLPVTRRIKRRGELSLL
ncbi:hypothetical protein CDAR_396701 [Caerostris darwini]|uniref:Uncharacterized protein n=1 Tax=Caerostris darwini TaxID=1538125 RepID=A0AAV4PSJ6_9ARAC|nr:hypothetical protein CDAR_396701 [Caerostris darwini]